MQASGRTAIFGPEPWSGPGAEVGNFAELKNTRLGARVKQHHVSYLGDAELGERTNVGAGTITANWDGRTKNRTTIGAGAFLGVDTMLVAPVEVGDGAMTGAGAVVTHDVPPGKLAVGVPARIREPRRPKGDPADGGERAMNLPITEILVLVGLTLLEGFFVAAEIALVSIRRSRVDQLVEEGNGAARRVRRLLDEPGRFLAVSQLGPDLHRVLRLGLRRGEPRRPACSTSSRRPASARPTRRSSALVIVTVILALFTIVFAELVPKTLALAHPERFALALSRPIDFLARRPRSDRPDPDGHDPDDRPACSARRSRRRPRSPPRSSA